MMRGSGLRRVAPIIRPGRAGGFMNRSNKVLAATSLSAAMLFTSAPQALEIRQFDKMAGQDQDEFIAELVQGAEKVLTDEGRPDLATQVSHLFTTNAPDGNISIGMSQFYMDLAKARLADAKRTEQDPNAQRLEVEDAMAVTMQQNHIDLPDSFFKVASIFKPKLPPQSKDKKEKQN
jgi:hypothetical protein